MIVCDVGLKGLWRTASEIVRPEREFGGKYSTLKGKLPDRTRLTRGWVCFLLVWSTSRQVAVRFTAWGDEGGMGCRGWVMTIFGMDLAKRTSLE